MSASATTIQRLIPRALRATGLLVVLAAAGQPAPAAGDDETRFTQIRPQFIAALGDPGASAGGGAQSWGLWRVDPGPRGVWLKHYERLQAAGGVAPARWQFDETDWWVEENGLIMEKPEFPLPPGQYVVTGGREVTTVLTIHPTGPDGDRRWELRGDATIHDVTHLRCRSARYTPAAPDRACSPAKAQMSEFPVAPGGAMPPVEGCHKQDYSVLFIVGVAVEG